MLDLRTEREHLVKAERDLAEGEARVARQTELLRHLRASGQDVRQAEALLRNLEQTLRIWKDHRDAIRATIVRIQHEHRA